MLASLCQVSYGQGRFYTTKFEDCGSLLQLAPAKTGSVKMTAPFDRRKGRHVLGKGRKVEICVEGTLPSGSQVPFPIQGLKNSAHGKIEVGALTVPLPVEFCGVQFDGCQGATPSCTAMKSGDNVKLCSSLTVPVESPDVDVEVTWKVLVDNNVANKDKCETEYDLGNLRRAGKLPLVCLHIPARVQPPRQG